MIRRTRIFALVLALALAVCGGAMAAAEEELLVASVNGIGVPVSEAYAEYSYYASIYDMYGYTEEDKATLREQIAESYAQLEVLYQQFDALGLTVDMEQVQADAEAEYERAIESYEAYVTDDSLTGEQLRQAAQELLAQDGYDEKYFVDYVYSNARIQALLDHHTADITASEEDVKAYYETRVADDRALYEGDPALYEEAVSAGETALYAPAGIRAVKHILVLLDGDGESRMRDLDPELEGILLKLAAGDGDAEALNARKAEIEQEMDEIFAAIEPRAQEIMDRLTAGEDFIALMEEYGEDPGMTYEPYRTDGYLVWADCGNWVTPFRDGAMALKEPGDISHPIRTAYGLHIIRYERDVIGGAVPFEDVRDGLEEEMLAELKSERVSGLLTGWYEAAEITLYPENLAAAEEAAAE